MNVALSVLDLPLFSLSATRHNICLNHSVPLMLQHVLSILDSRDGIPYGIKGDRFRFPLDPPFLVIIELFQ